MHNLHKLIVGSIGIFVACLPLAASAATLADIETQLMYTLGTVAVLKAEASGSTVACALIASKSSVTVGESFELIWNSFGAKDPTDGDAASQWARGGISTIIVDKPGTHKYEFVFHGVDGSQAKCTTIIVVRSK